MGGSRVGLGWATVKPKTVLALTVKNDQSVSISCFGCVKTAVSAVALRQPIVSYFWLLGQWFYRLIHTESLTLH